MYVQYIQGLSQSRLGTALATAVSSGSAILALTGHGTLYIIKYISEDAKKQPIRAIWLVSIGESLLRISKFAQSVKLMPRARKAWKSLPPRPL
jgi:hypothetical protein